jgi:general secretion pathway protein G
MVKIKKRALTLIEIMIVIFIIGLIGSVIGYNMKGSLDEGKSFKSEQGSKQVYDFLTLQIAQKKDAFDKVLADPEEALRDTGFVNRADKLIKDGWNQKYIIEKIDVPEGKDPDFIVFSKNWYNFLKNKKKLSNQEMQEEYPWAFHFDEDELKADS